jgi:hypothetical protein
MAQEQDYLAMSDEEWLRAAVPPPVVDTSSVQNDEDVTPNSTETPEAAKAEATTDTDTEDAAEAAPSDEPSGESSVDAEDADEGESGNTAEAAAETSPESDAAKVKADEEIDYRAAYEKLTRPFRANGKEIQVKNIDDAIALMQMGANYNKKMAAIKPNLKLLKLLETHDLLSEEKLGFLIDVQKKNPAAISKLIKESGIDPLDLDESKAADYKPSVHRIDDREIELDQVLEDIQDSPAYSKTLHVVSKEWDQTSRQIIAEQPQLLKVLNAHMENGVFDLIAKELEHERMMGRLEGLSDIEAYRTIGDAIHARGGFNSLGRQGNTAPAAKPVMPPSKPKPESVEKVKEKKRAASPTAVSTPKAPPKEFNPLAMSDEEFSKLVKPQYL